MIRGMLPTVGWAARLVKSEIIRQDNLSEWQLCMVPVNSKNITIVSPARTQNMRQIRSKNTQPELRVRRALRELRVGYRLHISELEGRPDIVMKGRKVVIFVHGCFWHRHDNCRRAFSPKTRVHWWANKLDKNVQRDKQAEESLRASGWRVCVIWECQTKDSQGLKQLVAELVFGTEGEA